MKNASISLKLLLLIFLVIAGTVIVFAVSTIGREMRLYSQHRYEQLSGNANILASLVAEDLSTANTRSILQRLTAISQLSNVDFVEVEDINGKIIAQLGDGTIITPRNFDLPQDGNFRTLEILNAKTISLGAPVIYQGNKIGKLRLYGSVASLKVQIVTVLGYLVFLSLSILICGTFAAWLLQRSVTEPIRRLTGVMDQIERKQNYTHQLPVFSDDETGQLTASFNMMMNQIRERDTRLEEYNHELENKVEKRTAQLQVAKTEAERANAAKSDFLAMISHEIRTPLNGMMVMADMLARAELEPKQKKHANVILSSGKNLLTIINDVLDLAKVEAGKLDLEQIAFSPEEIVEMVQLLFSEKAAEKGLDLSFAVDPSVPAHILGDPVRVHQVLANLVNNALKFTDVGRVRITCKFIRRSATRTEQASTRDIIYFAIEDTGIGIAHDKQKTIFDPFAQADQSTTRRFGGTGLGLSICERLVKAMDGKISLASEPGVGSRFSFAFPTLEMALSQDPVTITAQQRDQTAGQNAISARQKVLIADDNPVNVEVMREVLSGLNLDVEAVCDGVSAIAAVKAVTFSTIFMDGSMPIMDGIVATRHIREWERNNNIEPVRIVALTADIAGVTRKMWADAGADEYISKPFSVDQIIKTIQGDTAKSAPAIAA